MDRYKELITDLLENNEKKIIRLKNHKPLFPIAEPLMDSFSDNREWNSLDKNRSSNMGYAGDSGTVNGLYLDFHMGEKDTIPLDIKPIINQLKADTRLIFIRKSDYIEVGWVGWVFRLSDNKDTKFLVRGWFEKASRCHKEGTGEFEEVMKVVCQ